MAIEDVVRALHEYQDQLIEKSKGQTPDFVGWARDPSQKAANTLLLTNDFALLLAVIFDQSMLAEGAWRYPHQLMKNSQLGHLNPEKLSNMNLVALDKVFQQTKPSLHYWRVASARTIRAATMVKEIYNSNAATIWMNQSPRMIERRLLEFDGIGQKKSSMLVNILYRDLQRLDLSNDQVKEIDVSNDVQVQRIFVRTGLVDKISEKAIVAAGRKYSPHYPGKLDLPAWVIGRDYCDNQSPKCNECVLTACCPKLIQFKT